MSDSHFADLFQFLANPRDEVRKVATQGLAAHSRDNAELNAFLADSETGDPAIAGMMEMLNVKNVNYLGDILSTLINVAADAQVAEALVKHKVVPRTMRLLTSLEGSNITQENVLRELSLMLLNNLTATHVAAVDDLLQAEDEDLRGFFVTKLKVIYDRLPPTGERDSRKWLLQICLNLTRTREGQLLVLEDEEWLPTLTELINSENEYHRSIALQVFRNISATPERHVQLSASSVPQIALRRLCEKCERTSFLQVMICEILASLIQSEEGVKVLDELSAKKLLSTLLSEGDNNQLLCEDAVAVLTKHVLPFLDDIQDVYVMGNEEDK